MVKQWTTIQTGRIRPFGALVAAAFGAAPNTTNRRPLLA